MITREQIDRACDWVGIPRAALTDSLAMPMLRELAKRGLEPDLGYCDSGWYVDLDETTFDNGYHSDPAEAVVLAVCAFAERK